MFSDRENIVKGIPQVSTQGQLRFNVILFLNKTWNLLFYFILVE